MKLDCNPVCYFLYWQNKAINNPVESHGEAVYPTYLAFLENFALPNADLFNFN